MEYISVLFGRKQRGKKEKEPNEKDTKEVSTKHQRQDSTAKQKKQT
jgi:hypothetical protein